MFSRFLASIINYCLSVYEYDVISERKTFKNYSDVNKNLDRKESSEMFDGEKLVTKQALSWKKQFDIGVIIPSKKRNCVNCKKDLICEDSDKLFNQTKMYASNPNELKRQPPNKIGHMLPWYKEK